MSLLVPTPIAPRAIEIEETHHRLRFGIGFRNHVQAAWRELTRPSRDNIASLDGARSLAVLLVIAGHIAAQWRQAGLPEFNALNFAVFRFGWSGVDLFFVLSGLLIGGQIWKELSATGTVNYSDFVIRRAFRIWPLYFAWLSVISILPAAVTPTISDWLLLSNYTQSGFYRGWSLSTEEHFYLVAPIVCVLLARRVRGIGVIVAFTGMLAAISIVRAITADALLDDGVRLSRVSNIMYYPFHLHCEGLIVGLVIAYVRHTWGDGIFGKVNFRGLVLKAATIMACGIVLGLVLRRLNPVVFPFLSVALIYGAIVVWLLVDRSIFSAPFRWPVWHIVARLSFGMYLNHLIFPDIGPALVLYAHEVIGANGFALLAAIIAASVTSAATALVTYVFVEQPFLQLRKKILADRRATA